MSMVPIVASAEELPEAIRFAQVNPTARWYVRDRAVALGHTADIPSDWGMTAAVVPELSDDAFVDGAVVAASFSAEDRSKLASEGVAMPDGSFPIRNRSDLEKAIKLRGSGKQPKAKVIRHIRRRAKALGCEDALGALTAGAIGEGEHLARGAGRAFNDALHPRGRDGKFIVKGGRVVIHGEGLDGSKVEGTVTHVGSDGIQVRTDAGATIHTQAKNITNAPTAKAHVGIPSAASPAHEKRANIANQATQDANESGKTEDHARAAMAHSLAAEKLPPGNAAADQHVRASNEHAAMAQGHGAEPQSHQLKAGDRVRDKATGRTGKVNRLDENGKPVVAMDRTGGLSGYQTGNEHSDYDKIGEGATPEASRRTPLRGDDEVGHARNALDDAKASGDAKATEEARARVERARGRKYDESAPEPERFSGDERAAGAHKVASDHANASSAKAEASGSSKDHEQAASDHAIASTRAHQAGDTASHDRHLASDVYHTGEAQRLRAKERADLQDRVNSQRPTPTTHPETGDHPADKGVVLRGNESYNLTTGQRVPPSSNPGGRPDSKVKESAHLENRGTSYDKHGNATQHDKFYESAVVEHPDGTASHVTRWGKNGTDGQVKAHHVDTPEQARKLHEAAKASKLRGGYYHESDDVHTSRMAAHADNQHYGTPQEEAARLEAPAAHTVRTESNGMHTVRTPGGVELSAHRSREEAQKRADLHNSGTGYAPVGDLAAKQEERANRTPREIGEALAADPSKVHMDELTRVARLGNKDAPAARAEIVRRDNAQMAREGRDPYAEDEALANAVAGPNSWRRPAPGAPVSPPEPSRFQSRTVAQGGVGGIDQHVVVDTHNGNRVVGPGYGSKAAATRDANKYQSGEYDHESFDRMGPAPKEGDTTLHVNDSTGRFERRPVAEAGPYANTKEDVLRSFSAGKPKSAVGKKVQADAREELTRRGLPHNTPEQEAAIRERSRIGKAVRDGGEYKPTADREHLGTPLSAGETHRTPEQIHREMTAEGTHAGMQPDGSHLTESQAITKGMSDSSLKSTHDAITKRQREGTYQPIDPSHKSNVEDEMRRRGIEVPAGSGTGHYDDLAGKAERESNNAADLGTEEAHHAAARAHDLASEHSPDTTTAGMHDRIALRHRTDAQGIHEGDSSGVHESGGDPFDDEEAYNAFNDGVWGHIGENAHEGDINRNDDAIQEATDSYFENIHSEEGRAKAMDSATHEAVAGRIMDRFNLGAKNDFEPGTPAHDLMEVERDWSSEFPEHQDHGKKFADIAEAAHASGDKTTRDEALANASEYADNEDDAPLADRVAELKNNFADADKAGGSASPGPHPDTSGLDPDPLSDGEYANSIHSLSRDYTGLNREDMADGGSDQDPRLTSLHNDLTTAIQSGDHAKAANAADRVKEHMLSDQRGLYDLEPEHLPQRSSNRPVPTGHPDVATDARHSIGSRVSHPEYGEGTVTDHNGFGSGDKTKVEWDQRHSDLPRSGQSWENAGDLTPVQHGYGSGDDHADRVDDMDAHLSSLMDEDHPDYNFVADMANDHLNNDHNLSGEDAAQRAHTEYLLNRDKENELSVPGLKEAGSPLKQGEKAAVEGAPGMHVHRLGGQYHTLSNDGTFHGSNSSRDAAEEHARRIAGNGSPAEAPGELSGDALPSGLPKPHNPADTFKDSGDPVTTKGDYARHVLDEAIGYQVENQEGDDEEEGQNDDNLQNYINGIHNHLTKGEDDKAHKLAGHAVQYMNGQGGYSDPEDFEADPATRGRGLEDIDYDAAGVPAPGDEEPADTSDHALHGIGTSATNKGTHSAGEVQSRVNAILQETDHDKAHKDLAKLMSEAKLGGKQRARYRELLNEHHGSTGGNRPAGSLSEGNPVRDRLAAAQASRPTPTTHPDTGTHPADEVAHDVRAPETQAKVDATAGLPVNANTTGDVGTLDDLHLRAAERQFPAGTPRGDAVRARLAGKHPLADASLDGMHQQGDRVHLKDPKDSLTSHSFDRVPSGPNEGQWHGAYSSTFGNTGRSQYPGQVTDPALIQKLDAAREAGNLAHSARRKVERNNYSGMTEAELQHMDNYYGPGSGRDKIRAEMARRSAGASPAAAPRATQDERKDVRDALFSYNQAVTRGRSARGPGAAQSAERAKAKAEKVLTDAGYTRDRAGQWVRKA